MASAGMGLEGDVRKSLLDRTDAEKVFRPWWDTLEDMLLNILIGLGKAGFGCVRFRGHSPSSRVVGGVIVPEKRTHFRGALYVSRSVV